MKHHIRLQARGLSFYESWRVVCKCLPVWPRRVVNFLFAAHHLAWTQHPTLWLCESCAILWLVLRAARSRWVRIGVLLMLCGLMMNGLVTAANAGIMPVVGIPSTFHPASPMWRAAAPTTRFAFLADQARLGLFSVGDVMMILGGILIVATPALRALKIRIYRTSNRRGLPCPDRTARASC